jgi:diguanylate cyclase (GGDEF)-like protein
LQIGQLLMLVRVPAPGHPANWKRENAVIGQQIFCGRGTERYMDHQDWQARTRQLHGQVAAIAGRDLKLWLFTFVVVLVLAMGILLVSFSNLLWAGASRSALELACGLVLVVIIFAGYILYKRHSYAGTRQELIREIIYSEKLQSLSLIDPLTQTFNIRYLDEVLPREINRANRHGCTITFMLIEPAGWAKVVEKSGELVGDQMLVEAAQLLKNTFRGSDIVLRYDVSRFLVIMPETAEQQAACAQRRLLDRLDSWNLESSAPFELDLRVGIAAYSRGADANSVLELAAERLQAGRQPAGSDRPSRDPAGCALHDCGSGLGREL